MHFPQSVIEGSVRTNVRTVLCPVPYQTRRPCGLSVTDTLSVCYGEFYNHQTQALLDTIWIHPHPQTVNSRIQIHGFHGEKMRSNRKRLGMMSPQEHGTSPVSSRVRRRGNGVTVQGERSIYMWNTSVCLTYQVNISVVD